MELRGIQRNPQGHAAHALQKRDAYSHPLPDPPGLPVSCFQSLASRSSPSHLREAWGKPGQAQGRWLPKSQSLGIDGNLSPFPKETYLLRSQLRQPWLETKEQSVTRSTLASPPSLSPGHFPEVRNTGRNDPCLTPPCPPLRREAGLGEGRLPSLSLVRISGESEAEASGLASELCSLGLESSGDRV